MPPDHAPSSAFDRAARRQLAFFGMGALAILGLLLVALDFAASLTGGGNDVSGGVDLESQTITIILRSEPPQLDSTLATDQVSGMVLGHIMEGLLGYDPSGHLVPGVAERWEIGERDAVFHLRADARWSDGKPVTADDFVFAWQQVVDPASASEYAFILYAIENAEAINRGELPVESLGVFAEGPQTLRVRLSRPVAYFEKLVAFPTYFPVRRDFFKAMNGRYGADLDTLLYNGPYQITRWVHGASLRLERNPEYWNRSRARIRVIDMPYLTDDPNTALNLFRDGRIAITWLSEQNLPDALQMRWRINQFTDGGMFFTEFNHRPERVTHNRNLRLAIALALDVDELVNKVLKQPGMPAAHSIFPSWMLLGDRPLAERYPPAIRRPDPDAARRHLALALEELGLERLPPLMLLTGDSPASGKQAEYYQAVLQRVLGIEIRIDKQIFKQRLAKMTSGDFDLVAAGWGPDFNDPLTFGDLFASWNLNNRGRYVNPELDAQIRIAQDSLDEEVRAAAFGRIQQIIHDDVVILPEFERVQVYVIDPRLKGVVRRVVGADPDYTYAWIEGG